MKLAQLFQSNPSRTIVQGFLIALLSVAVGIGLPLYVAIYTDTLFDSQLLERIKIIEPARYSEYVQYESAMAHRALAITTVENQLLESVRQVKPSSVGQMLQAYRFLDKWEAPREPFRIAGYYMDDIIPLWPLFYAFMGWLIVIFRPHSPDLSVKTKSTSAPHDPIGWRKWFSIHIERCYLWIRTHLWEVSVFSVVWITYRVPTWVRNFCLPEDDRKSFSFANYDISRVGFFTQEAMALFVIFLLVVLWYQWIDHLRNTARELELQTESTVSEIFNVSRIKRIQDEFLSWQIASILLFGAFGYYTFFFWKRTTIELDFRFLPQAIVVHALWIVTWAIISAPVLVLYRDWSISRLRAIADIVNLSKEEGREQLLAAIKELQPISLLNLSWSGIIAVASLVFPLFKGLV